MTLNLTSCARVHEPGFSRSEALELARLFENGSISSPNDEIDCDRWDCEGIVRCETELSVRARATIVAALRAFAA